MDICWRWPPLIALVAVAGHATSWFGATNHAAAGHSGPVAALGGLLSGADSLINQVFAWLFVLVAFELLCCVVGYLIGEYKLHRMYDRPSRSWGRARPPAPHDLQH
jgi:hypothetical protein